MSLINNMLRDLDARRALPANRNITALQTAGISASNPNRQGIIYVSVVTAMLLVAVFTGLLIGRLPAQALSHLPGVPVTNKSPATTTAGVTYETGMPVNNQEYSPGLQFQTSSASTISPVITTTDGPAGPGLPEYHADDSEILHLRSAHPAPNPSIVTALDAPVDIDLPANNPDGEQSQSGIVMRTPSFEQQLARTYHEATTAARAGDVHTATGLLEDLLDQDSSHMEARLLLANLYVRQQRNENAVSLLTGSLTRHPLHVASARLLAHLLAAEERYSEAIEYLQTAVVGAAQDADYHALLAGLYQRTGKPGAAASHFTIALQLSPNHGEWWMGLGISQEQAGDIIAAQAAYLQALQYPLNATLHRYINQRLQQSPPKTSLHGGTDTLFPGKV